MALDKSGFFKCALNPGHSQSTPQIIILYLFFYFVYSLNKNGMAIFFKTPGNYNSYPRVIFLKISQAFSVPVREFRPIIILYRCFPPPIFVP